MYVFIFETFWTFVQSKSVLAEIFLFVFIALYTEVRLLVKLTL